jgi:hypothetical protein
MEFTAACRKIFNLPDMTMTAAPPRTSERTSANEIPGPPRGPAVAVAGGQTGSVDVTSSTVIAKQALKKGVQASTATPEGGLFTAGIADDDNPEYLKISAGGTLEWRQVPADPAVHERAAITGRASRGGYWVIGTALTRNLSRQESTGPGWVERVEAVTYEYLRQIDQSGRASSTQRIARVTEAHGFSCGVEVAGGYVLAGGVDGGAQHANQWVPWMEMIDRTGKQIWSRSFAEDHGEQLALFPADRSCPGLISTAAGSVTWAVNVRVTAITPTGDAWVKAVSNPELNHPATFLVQVAPNGAETRRARHDFVSDAFLFTGNDGLILFERRVAKGRALPTNGATDNVIQASMQMVRAKAAESGARVTRLDQGLNERSGASYVSAELSHSIDAVYLTPAGGFIVSGCDQGTNLLGYVGPAGQIGPSVKASPEGMQECSRFAFAKGQTPHSVLLLAANDLWGVRILTVQYP